MHIWNICKFVCKKKEGQRDVQRKRDRRDRDRERGREPKKRGFKITIWPFCTFSISYHRRCEHIFLALIVFPYFHNEKDIHWHPQQHSILDKYHIHTLYMPCTMKSNLLDILVHFSSGFVVITSLLCLWQFHCILLSTNILYNSK